MGISKIFEKDEGRLPVIGFQTPHDTGSAGSGPLDMGADEIEPNSFAKRRLPRVHSPIMTAPELGTYELKDRPPAVPDSSMQVRELGRSALNRMERPRTTTGNATDSWRVTG